MLLRIILFLTLSLVASTVRGQQAKLVEHLDQAASQFGYSLIYTPSSIPDTAFVFSISDSASAKTSFERLTKPFGLTYNLLANQAIITATKPELVTISGFVQDATSGERLVGAAVYIENSPRGTYTNGYGYFSLRRLNDTDVLTIKYLGYPAKQILAGSVNQKLLTVQLRANYQLELVEIFPVDGEQSQLPSSGQSIPQGLLRKTEYMRGRPDLNEWLGIQSGISSAASGFGGFSLRGADPNHNLILLDDATLYLPSHLFGNMSIIPGESINSVQLFKNAGSARYGDRVGGVLDIRLKDGSTEKRRTSFNFGLSDISFNTEGPVGRGSYFLSGRRGLTDFWLKALRPTIQPQETNIPNIDYTFYDLAGKINYPIGPRHRIQASIFSGSDRYQESDEVTYFPDQILSRYLDRSSRSWSNLVSSIRYNVTIGSRWFANTTFTVSQFNYDASDFILQSFGINEPDPVFIFSQDFFSTRLRDIGFRQDVEFAWKEDLSLKFGVDAVQHRFQVGNLGNRNVQQELAPTEIDPSSINIPSLNTYDISSYGYVDWHTNDKLDLNLGFRISGQLGGEKTYLAVLPRVSFEYKASRLLSFHGDAGFSRQYVHQVSTLNPGLPRDLWVPSTNGLRPQESRYITLGSSVETNKNQSFRLNLFANQLDGLSRFGNEIIGGADWTQNIRSGEGYSYGAEFTVTGSISTFQYDVGYTFMRANRRYEDGFGEVLEQERFSLDRRHFLTVSTRYPLTDRWGVGATWKIGSGLPARIPELNPFRPNQPPTVQPLTNPWSYSTITDMLPAFHTLDIGFRFTKKVKANVYNLSFGVQNVYMRRNPLFINLQAIGTTEEGDTLYDYTVLNTLPILPFLRYGITF